MRSKLVIEEEILTDIVQLANILSQKYNIQYEIPFGINSIIIKSAENRQDEISFFNELEYHLRNKYKLEVT